MKRVKAYVVDVMGVYFWKDFAEKEEEKRAVETLGKSEVVLAKDVERLIEQDFLRVLEKGSILQPFFIVVDDCCKKIKFEKGGAE